MPQYMPVGQQQIQNWWMPGSGNPYMGTGNRLAGSFNPGGLTSTGVVGGLSPMNRPQRPVLQSGPTYGYSMGGPQPAPTQPAAPPDYTGLNSQFMQQFQQFLGNMYQPPQQINFSSQPIANRPMTYRPIQQSTWQFQRNYASPFGNYSRF